MIRKRMMGRTTKKNETIFQDLYEHIERVEPFESDMRLQDLRAVTLKLASARC